MRDLWGKMPRDSFFRILGYLLVYLWHLKIELKKRGLIEKIFKKNSKEKSFYEGQQITNISP